MRLFAIVGAVFVSLSLAGAFVPGLEFRVYFGTTEGATKWHQKHFSAKEQSNDKQQTIP